MGHMWVSPFDLDIWVLPHGTHIETGKIKALVHVLFIIVCLRYILLRLFRSIYFLYKKVCNDKGIFVLQVLRLCSIEAFSKLLR